MCTFISIINDFDTVLSCEPPQWPENGNVHCDKSEIIAGTTCKVRCNAGFRMNPNTPTIKCLKKENNVSMDKETPFCEGMLYHTVGR